MDLTASSKRKRIPSTTAIAPQAEATGRERKRAKTQDARTIAVQTSDKALKDGQLDVDKFVKAREYEIRALEAGLSKSKKALTTRAFQSVPKDLRRRTASHNVKRVPKRLRNRAEKEMVEDNTPTVTARSRKPTPRMRLRLETAQRLQQLGARANSNSKSSKSTGTDPEKMVSIKSRQPKPKVKQNTLETPPNPPAKFRKRQLHKTWLPTHLFHAKRAHMTAPKDPLWRFALPLTPTEKSYRPTHRVSTERGAIAWDTSYIATIGLEGVSACIESALKSLGVHDEDEIGGLWGKRGRKWREGKRSWEAWIFEKNKCPNKAIAPVKIVWCADALEEGDPKSHNAGSGRPKNAKAKARKIVLIRVHPSAFLQVWEEVLKVSKMQSPPVVVEDLRFEIGSIEVTGPGSTEALRGVLHPKVMNGTEAQAIDSPEHTWTSVASLSNPACLPPNAVLGFCISDPRLHHPPRTLSDSQIPQEDLQRILASWPPDSTQTAPPIFDRPSRQKASRSLPSQKSINRRKGLALPGSYPCPLPSDPSIPILLLTSRPPSSAAQGTWTVLLPWKCVLPVWYPLMHYPLSTGGQVRFGGLREKRQVSFEAGIPWFPADYPGTKAGWEWEVMERERRLKEWAGRPKSKRIEWESVGLGEGQKGEIGMGWACDWEKLTVKPATGTNESVELAPAPQAPAHPQAAAAEAAPLSCPPSGIYHLVSTPTSQYRTSIPPSLPPEMTSSPTNVILMTVKITVLSRGTPTPCARIYTLENISPSLRFKWLSLIPTTSNRKPPPKTKPSRPRPPSKDAPPHIQRQHLAHCLLTPTKILAASDTKRIAQAGDADYPNVPGDEALIGFVTTGNLNLKEGRGVGIGCLDVGKVGKGKGREGREGRLCVVREAGMGVGRLARWEPV